MTEKRLLALLAMLIGLVGGILLFLHAVDIGPRTLDLSMAASAVVTAILGIAIIVGSLLIYRGQYASGGIVNIVLGLLVIILPQGNSTDGILAIISGVVGLVASEAGR